MAAINYTPPPTVKQFMKDDTFMRFIIGPVGSGKTTGGLMSIPHRAAMQAPSPVDGIKRTRAVVVRNTMPQLRDTTISSWNYWFKDGQAGTWRASNMSFDLCFGNTQCEVLFRALDTPDDIARVLSLETTFVMLDEFVQIPKEIVEALTARVGRYPPAKDGGPTWYGMWGASNADNEDNWWHDFLYGDPVHDATGVQISGCPSNVAVYTQPSGFSKDAENIENLPGKQDYYINLAQGKTPQWIKQYIECVWGYSVRGRPVIPMFNQDTHVSKIPLHVDSRIPVVVGYDPGLAGSAFIFGQLMPTGQLRVLDEIVLKDYDTKRAISDRVNPLIRAKYRDCNIVIAPDPSANNRTQNDATTSVQTLRNAGFEVSVDTNNLLQPRIEAVNYFVSRLVEGGAPAFLLDPSCKRLASALRGGWRYSKILRTDRESPEPEKNAHSHPGDALTYFCRYYMRAAVRQERSKRFNFAMPRFANPYVY